MNGIDIVFDNNDKRIKHYELLLESSLDSVSEYPLPVGYYFEFYQDGDRDTWIEIEKSAKEFSDYDEGLAAWNRYYLGRENELYNRMVFVTNSQGEKVGTATAFYDINGKDQSSAGWLHWVAIKRAYQGRGLSKPLITYLLNVMKALGYNHAKIPTQTNTWLAVKVYLDLGFTPIPENAVHSYMGWCIIKTLTKHKALNDFDSIDEGAIHELLTKICTTPYGATSQCSAPSKCKNPQYICKIATVDELETKWDAEIKQQKSPNWKIWKSEAVERVKNRQSIVYYGILNGKAVCEATAMFDKNAVQNSDGLVDAQTAYLCAFRTEEKYQGKGYFSELFRFMLCDLRRRGYRKVTLGVEPTETENLKIYQHLGFHTFIKSAQETYPDGTVIDVDYYARDC